LFVITEQVIQDEHRRAAATERSTRFGAEVRRRDGDTGLREREGR
jgi:hypothetical protein